VVVATLYNNFSDAHETTGAITDVSQCLLELDPILLDMNEFRELFYPSASGSFSLNAGLRGSGVTSFSEQTISDQDGTHEFNLMDFVLSSYENELNIQRNNIAPLHLIQLHKDLSRYSTMFDIRGSAYSLKWSEILSVLQQLGGLKNPDESLLFKIIFNYRNTVLSPTTPIQVIFNYKVVNMFPNYWQFRGGIPKQKIHPNNPLRITPQFIKRADGTILSSGAGFPGSRHNYSIRDQDAFGQRVLDGNSQQSELISRFKKEQRKEALDDLFESMLENPLSDNILDNCI